MISEDRHKNISRRKLGILTLIHTLGRDTGGYRGIQEDTGGYRGDTGGYRGCRRIQGDIGGYCRI